jgi:hypothetical protein
MSSSAARRLSMKPDAIRQREKRARAKNDWDQLRIDVNLAAVANALIGIGVLARADRNNVRAIERALSEQLRDWADGWPNDVTS